MPYSPETWLPIGISSLSLVLAGVALGWNIYRDVILKARVQVNFSVVEILSDLGGHLGGGPSKLRISVTNHGPGPVQIISIHGRVAPWWRRLIRRPKHFMVIQDRKEPLSPQLPTKLDVGDSISLLPPHDEHSFLSTEATHIGVIDSFGRAHMAPLRDIRDGRIQFKKDFPKGGSEAGS